MTDLTLIIHCGHFLIKAEGGANNYKRDLRLPLCWRSFTVDPLVQRKGNELPLHQDYRELANRFSTGGAELEATNVQVEWNSKNRSLR